MAKRRVESEKGSVTREAKKTVVSDVGRKGGAGRECGRIHSLQSGSSRLEA